MSHRLSKLLGLKPLNPPQCHWAGKRVWVIGASSGIGRATASALHAAGALITVSARNVQALTAFVHQHPGAQALPLDVTHAPDWGNAVHHWAKQGRIDCVLFCAGTYQALRADDYALHTMLAHNTTNYVGALRLLDAVLPMFLAQGAGHISLVSSVAGFRALPQSLAYGPTKAALTHLAEGLYLDLRAAGIGVSVVHPGFIETPLTAKNTFAMPALMTSDAAAQAILRGWHDGLFEIHFPKRFTRWLKVLRLMPYRVYFFCISRFTGL
jgi:NAD(P)-dependent dehydrogenase (short-subunit alcohol dehydrogenase family)